jgi:type VI secretion system protein VasG
MKGEFEQRLRSVIDEVQASPKPIILFIDETHTLVGAGGAAGTGDAANLLKPALARGTLRTIGATTWAEYKKYIEKDPALTRRFQAVQVDEPDERQGHPDDAWRGQHDGEAPQGADPRRGARGRGQALAPLHPGAPAARQGGQPARHRLRARGRQPARHAGRGGRLPQAHRGAEDRGRHHRPREGHRHRGGRARGCRGGRAAGRGARAPGRLEARWKDEKALVDELLALRAKLRGGSRWKAPAAPLDSRRGSRGAQRTGRASAPPCCKSCTRCRPGWPRCRATRR